jgi:endonuclease/exonuclease/phosphatase family metal-dependent hydrolase
MSPRPVFKRIGRVKTRYRIAAAVCLLALAVVIGPYVYSRALSTTRALELETLAAAQIDTTGAREDGVLRVACYNIAHGRGLAVSNDAGGSQAVRRQRLDDLAAMLVELDADVVVLNEADFDASWSFSVDQASDLAGQAGYPHVAKLSNLDFRVAHRSWRFGNAVLSRYPIVDAYEIDLPGYATSETLLAGKKRALYCEIEKGTQRFGVVAIHLSHRSEGLRVESARRLIRFVESSSLPIILAGDFNSTPTGLPDSRTDPKGDNAMDVFDASGRFTRFPEGKPSNPTQYTFRSDDAKRIIDWILVSEGLQLVHGGVHPSELSDHRPVVADVERVSR